MARTATRDSGTGGTSEEVRALTGEDIALAEVARLLHRIESKLDVALDRISSKLERISADHERRLRHLERSLGG